MRKVLVLVAVVFALALVTSAYAQKWDSADEAKAIAKGKEFKFSGIEILSVEPKAQIAYVQGPKGNKAVIRLGYAKYEGGYSGVGDLKAGDKISGEGVVVNGTNWITKVRKSEAGEKSGVAPKKD